MSTTSKTRFAILGMLSIRGPCTGYDIKKEIEASISYFWNESYGNLYPILRRLEQESLATCTVQEQTGRPNRNVYTVTAAGRHALRAWLTEDPDPAPVRNELLLKLFFGRHLGIDGAILHLMKFQLQESARLEHLLDIERMVLETSASQPDFPFSFSTLRMGIIMSRARLEWAAESLERLRQVPKST
ncbi:MAG: PadR family transcriptional regulator [Planctomycetota bacterium]